MSYEYSYIMDELMETGVLTALFSIIPSGFSTLLSIVSYVFTSLALYTVAQRRGLNRPWLAWIPVVNCWIIGSLSDQYRYVVKGEVKSKRKVLLILQLLLLVMGIAMAAVAIVTVVNLVSNTVLGAPISEREAMEMVLGPLVGIVGMCLPVMGISIAYAVIRYMALYDIYRSMDPVNCVLFTVLSILFGVTEPFFLFFNRNKDLGMPPRRQEYDYAQPEYRQQEPVREFWEEPENTEYL